MGYLNSSIKNPTILIKLMLSSDLLQLKYNYKAKNYF